MGGNVSRLCKDFRLKLKSNCISNCCSNGASQEIILHDISPKEHKTKHHKKDKKDKIHITDKEVQTDIKQEPEEEAKDIVG